MEAPRSMPRRRFLRVAGMTLAAGACSRSGRHEDVAREETAVPPSSGRVVLAENGAPERHARAILDAWGGVESLIGKEDLVVFKVNAQWYAQGMTNTDALAEMIRAILERPGGFAGEIVIADNHHYKQDLSRGWTTNEPNGRMNYLALVRSFREAGFEAVGAVQWHDAGKNPDPWQGDAGGGRLVRGPGEGDGYRWWLEECHVTPEGNRCAMTWPVFTSPLRGETVDLRDGVFDARGSRVRPLRMINISSLNHHSRYAGVTASIKNLMGVVDMTCGFQGPEPEGYFNTHYIGMKPSHATWRWARKHGGPVGKLVRRLLPEEKAIDFQHTGGALGHWVKTVRRPDLHVVTAHWVGFGSRTRREYSAWPLAMLASDDPVTLDAVAAREVLMPATKWGGERGAPFLELNDPDRPEGPFRLFLEEARKKIGGRLDRGEEELVRLTRA